MSIDFRAPLRRDILKSGLAVGGLIAAANLVRTKAAIAATASGLDPVDLDIRFGTTSSIWGRTHSTEFWIRRVGELGLQGIEPYPQTTTKWYDIKNNVCDPKGLKKLFDAAGITFIDCSNGAAGQSTNFIDPDAIPKTISDHVAMARDFLAPLGADHWKCNMGRRPDGGPTDDQLKRLADTANKIGEQTIKYGVRLALHPHIWGPMEREHDVRTVMANTDPRYVWMTLDTGHNVLGGMVPQDIISEYFPRIAEIHLKDTYAKYRGNRSTPTQEQHKIASVYHNLGGGGVDFPAVFKVLREKHFKGWAIFDVDGPRQGDDGYDALGGDQTNEDLRVDDYFAININYLRDVLGVRLPPPG